MQSASGLLNLDVASLIFCAAALFAAGFVRGYSGFGMSAVIMASLSFFLPPAELVPLVIGLEILASLGQARSVWKDIDWRILGWLCGGALIGKPIGVYVLTQLDADLLKAILLGFILFASIVLWLSPSIALRLSTILLALTGVASGIVNGAAGVGGLVVALAFTAGRTAAPIVRATFIAYLFAIDLWGMVLLSANGLFDPTATARILFAAPVMAIGLWLGSKRFIATNPQSFRAFVLALLSFLSAIGLIRIVLG